VSVAGRDLRLLIPTTYMNESGKSVGAVAKFFKIAADDILVAHDELDLLPGTARLKKGGGAGGHNGLKDIISALGNEQNFYRLRIGIGHPGSAPQVINYVLKKASTADQQLIDDSIVASLNVMPKVLAGEWEKAMQQLHTSR
jgi:peptidyl-tRNA hydrolase, PTH1 family